MGLFSKSKKQTVPATGFYSMPGNYRDLYNNVLKSGNDLFFSNGSLNYDMFTPLAETADETRAFDMMRAGFTPTEETIGQDLSMLMNPFDQYVVDDLNKQAQGENSLARQYISSTGQMGSNRDMLAASDVEQNRLNSIGQFKQSQYNQALNQTLNQLPALRQNDATNLTNIGGFQRDLNMQTNLAPYNSLMASQGFLGNQPTSFGNFGTKEHQIKVKSGGLGSMLGTLAPIVGTALGGPIGGMIGGAVGGAMNGGGLKGAFMGGVGSAVTGGLGGGMGSAMTGGLGGGSIAGGAFGGSSSILGSLGQGNALSQVLGSIGSKSQMGPYQPITSSFFR